MAKALDVGQEDIDMIKTRDSDHDEDAGLPQYADKVYCIVSSL